MEQEYPSLQARESLELAWRLADYLRWPLAGATKGARGLRAMGGGSASRAGS
jgi:hypothetical protein